MYHPSHVGDGLTTGTLIGGRSVAHPVLVWPL
jgi:hypothetical protein